MAKKTAEQNSATAADGRAARGTEDLDALKRENAALRAQLGARGPDPDVEVASYPKAKYRKVAKPNPRWPNGYEARRVADPDEEARLGSGWYDSPADVPGASV